MISLAVSGLAVILLARWLGPGDYGLIPLINSIIAFVLIFSDCGISSATARYIAQAGLSDRGVAARILRDGLAMLLGPCVGFTLLCMVSGRWLGPFFKEPRLATLLPIGALLLFGRTLLRFFVRTTQGFHEMRLAAMFSIFSETLLGLFALIAVLMGGGVAAALWGRSGGAWIGTIGVFAVVWRLYLKGQRSTGESYRGQVLRYGFPLLMTTMSFYIYTQSAVMLIEYFLDSSQVAFYNVPQALIQKLQLPAIALGSTLGPLLGTLFKNADREKITGLFRYGTKYLFTLYLPVTAGLFILAKPVVHLLLGDKYLPSVEIVQIYAPFLFFYALSGLISPIYDYAGKARFRALLIFGSASANVLLNLWMIPRFGIAGAGWCALITYCPAITVLFIVAGRWCGDSLISRTREMVGLVGATVACSVFLLAVRSHANSWPGFILALIIGSSLYGGIVAGLKIVTWREVQMTLLQRGKGKVPTDQA